MSAQPSYPSTFNKGRARLISQVAPRIIGTETPIQLYDGTSNNGAFISQLTLQQLGDNVATTIRFYSQISTSETYDLLIEHGTTAVSGASDASAISLEEVTLPVVSPKNAVPENRGIRLEPGESLYCALGIAVATGINVFAEIQEY